MRVRRWLNAIVALTGFVGAGYVTACASSTDISGGEERIGEAEQAVGVGGTCTAFQHCDTGLSCCNGGAINGYCRNLTSDVNNCGSCGNVCPDDAVTSHHRHAVCSGSTCGYACDSGYGNCDFNSTNGCESSLTTTLHCGSCAPCSYNHGTPACSLFGQCSMSSCQAGWANCDNENALRNGCETDVTTTTNCGGCGNQCVATKQCINGSCQCPASAPNYCTGPGCVDFQTDEGNCGSCGHACNVAGGEICSGGQCVPKPCTVHSDCVQGTVCSSLSGGGHCAVYTCPTTCPQGTACCAGDGTCEVLGVNPCNCTGCGDLSAGQACCIKPDGTTIITQYCESPPPYGYNGHLAYCQP